MAVKILLVDLDAQRLAERTSALQLAGYEVATAAAFHEARAAIVHDPPNLLVSAVRLGPFNGLHLVILSRSDYPEMAAIVMGTLDDLGLAADAKRQGASYLVEPATASELLAMIAQILAIMPT